MSNDQKIVSISTIPLTKLTIVMNNFIANTITHLNKLSVKGDEKLAEFDNKLNDLDAMTTLLEAKLFSLPENITSTYPPLKEVKLDDDINPVIIPNPVASVSQDNSNSNTNSKTAVVSGSGGSVPVPPPPPPPPTVPSPPVPTVPQPPTNPKPVPVKGEPKDIEEQQEGEAENLTPEQELDNFLKEHSNFANIYKSMKVGAPTVQLERTVKNQGFDIDLYHELVEKAKKVHPNIK